MKKISVPQSKFTLSELDVEGKTVLHEAKIHEFLILVIRSCPSSKATIDKIFEVGKLISKLKEIKDEDEILLDNDEYKLIEHAVLKEMFEPWVQYQNHQGTIPTGWEAIGLNPIHETIMTFLQSVKDVQEYHEGKK